MDIRVTIDEFKTLPRQEQFDIVFTIGDFIQASPQGRKRAILYAVDYFFVELCFDPKVNKIINVSAFESNDILKKNSGKNQEFKSRD